VLKRDFHRDHKTPLTRGGTNWPSNIQLLCRKCNVKKARWTHREYLEILARRDGSTIRRL
jgi:5-methylcytosine-specific restriction endonuclease McrA